MESALDSPSMVASCALALGLVAVLALRQQGGQAEEGVPLELRVNRSIALAVDYLRTRQSPDGRFALHEEKHPGGATALGALALAVAGVRRNDDALVRALKFLEYVEWKSTYSSATFLLACEAVGDWPKRAAAARQALDFLVSNQNRGVWAYPWDHLCGSNTQWALMGLLAAHRMGLVVPEQTLFDAAQGLWLFQDRSGGFVYKEGERPYAGMTAAALAGIAVLETIGADSIRVRNLLRKHEGDRERAEAWLEQRFDPARNTFDNGTWTPFWHYAYMWAIERWCGLTGRTQVAGVDWYRAGAAWLVDTQAGDGSWSSDDKHFENTCLALLFLRRATVSDQGELEEIYRELDRARAERNSLPERPGAEALRLTDWWLAGPWQGKPDGLLLDDPPFDVRDVRPKERTKLARRAWEAVQVKADGWTNLEDLTGRSGDLQLWCLATTLEVSGTESFGGYLWLELEDGWDVWLDDRRLSRERRVRSAINGDVRIELDLSPGVHRLVVLVEDEHGAAAFGARVTNLANTAPGASFSAAAHPGGDKR
jgi:hypothetical protein